MTDRVIAVSQFLVRLWFRARFRLRVEGREHFPDSGPVIVASNHVSAYDPPLVGAHVPSACYYLAKKELFDIPGVRSLIRFYRAIPVDRDGVSLGALREIKARLQDGAYLVMFPEGTRTRNGELGSPKEGIGMLVAQTRATIVPAYIDGLFGVHPGPFSRPAATLRFGRPIRPTEVFSHIADRRLRYDAIARAVYDGIRELAPRPEPEAAENAPVR